MEIIFKRVAQTGVEVVDDGHCGDGGVVDIEVFGEAAFADQRATNYPDEHPGIEDALAKCKGATID